MTKGCHPQNKTSNVVTLARSNPDPIWHYVFEVTLSERGRWVCFTSLSNQKYVIKWHESHYQSVCLLLANLIRCKLRFQCLGFLLIQYVSFAYFLSYFSISAFWPFWPILVFGFWARSKVYSEDYLLRLTFLFSYLFKWLVGGWVARIFGIKTSSDP